jgi:hypothetical protein
MNVSEADDRLKRKLRVVLLEIELFAMVASETITVGIE